MNRIPLYAGDALLRIAGVCAALGRKLLGKPATRLARAHEAGSQVLMLEARVPGGITTGFSLHREDSFEVVRTKRVDGARVEIDRPLSRSYPKGSLVKVLI